MAYTPTWNALFAKPLLNQCIALIQRDQAAAIALVNSALVPINEFHKGPGMRTAFPWLTVAWEGNPFNADQDHYRQSSPRISLVLDVGQFDQEMAQDNAADYARVLDVIITTSTGPDWETSLSIVHETVPGGMTTPNASGTVKRVFVEDHRPGIVTLQEIPEPVLRVTLPIAFELFES